MKSCLNMGSMFHWQIKYSPLGPEREGTGKVLAFHVADPGSMPAQLLEH